MTNLENLSNKVEKLSTVPSAFSAIAEKVNEVIDANLPLKAGNGISITKSPNERLISLNLDSKSLYTSLGLLARTFYASPNGALACVVSPGTINNVLYSGGTFSSLAAGDKIYIDATVDAAGTVTAVTVSKAASVPSNSSTHAYTLLATVAVTSGIATLTPVAWNYSQVQKCGTGTTYYWGGFGY